MALYQLENGGERFVVWTWDKAMAHGEKFSDSFDKNSPWASPWLSNETSAEEMAKKSVLKALLKYAPKSVEGQIESALHADGNAIIADKFDEGGNMTLDFDVKQIAPPDPEMQETMNRINGESGRTEEEPEPVNRGNAGESAPAVIALADRSIGTPERATATGCRKWSHQQAWRVVPSSLWRKTLRRAWSLPLFSRDRE